MFDTVTIGLRHFVCLLAALIGTGCEHSNYALSRSVAMAETAAPVAAARPTADDAVATNTTTVSAPTEASNRMMVYNASMRVVVLRVTETQKAIRSLARELGGFLQEMTNDRIVVKVPAARLDTAMERIARLGEVTDQHVKGSDVTEEWTDLHLRLKNAHAGRDRLVELLAKAERVEDMLKVQTELTKLTEMIERIEGRIRYLKEAIAYSVIEVHLNSPVGRQDLAIQVPFPWVRELAAEFVGGTRPASIDQGWFKKGIRFDLPDGFVKYYEQPTVTRALSADGVLLKVAIHDNYQGGSLEFWSTLIHRSLTESRAIRIEEERDMTTNSGRPMRLIFGKKIIGQATQTYMVAVTTTSRSVYVYEAWGEAKAATGRTQAIQQSLLSLQP